MASVSLVLSNAVLNALASNKADLNAINKICHWVGSNRSLFPLLKLSENSSLAG
jgi:uncharacterized protein YjiS (DUF1127 family)